MPAVRRGMGQKMKSKISLLVAGVAVVAVVAAGGYYLSPMLGGTTSGGAKDFSVAATPLGITIEPLGATQGYGPQRLLPQSLPKNEIVYANEKGLTLYTYDKDEPTKSNCTGDCAKTWIAVTPVANAKPVPGWTIIGRDDGGKQWARNGKPLYTFVDDKEGGDVGGKGAVPGVEGGGRREAKDSGLALTAKLPDGWKAAKFQTGGVPTTGITPPAGLSIEEVIDANGIGITDTRDMTVYAFSGDVNNDKPDCGKGVTCTSRFIPVSAPQLAAASGDWTYVERNDGIKQWLFKGAPLYTYEGDLIPGDVNGRGVDARWHAATIQNYYLPPNVTLQPNAEHGIVLGTATGMTLYRRDLDGFNPASHQLAHDHPYRQRIGRTLQKVACDAACSKTWHPYLAPADAQPSGNWGIAVLADGKKQWTYKDYGLFTYDGDKKPGDMTGDEIYDIVISSDPNKINDVGFAELGPVGLNWSYAGL
jgi:predicted lipoprotein with Yx(FWY)xxD motif